MELKTCLNCQKTFEKRENENNFRYKLRKYCSQECYRQLMKRERKGWYSHNTWPKASENAA